MIQRDTYARVLQAVTAEARFGASHGALRRFGRPPRPTANTVAFLPKPTGTSLRLETNGP